MEPKKLLTADYLDIVFDHRNKKYGGYELRRHYNRRIKKAFAFAITGVVALFSFSFISVNHKDVSNRVVRDSVYTLANIQPIIPPPPKPPVTPPPPPIKHIKTNPFTDPIIEPDIKVLPDKVMTENKNLTDVQPGISKQGTDSTGIAPLPGNGIGKDIGDNGKSKSNDPVRWVEQMPQFIGDLEHYLGSNLHYPEAARLAGIEGKVAIEFIVNEDGSVSNAKVTHGIGGGCDEEALRIVNAMPKWKPGKQNGTPVKVFFVLPIVFMLN